MSTRSDPRSFPAGAGEKNAAGAARGSLKSGALLLAALAVGAATQSGIVRSVHVDSAGMTPTLEPDDRVLVRGLGSSPGVGDVVAYRSPLDAERLRFGRIVAVEGDRVERTQQGLRTNGHAVASPAPAGTADGSGLLFAPRLVPEGHVFVLGDNPADDRDSRIYGSIPRSAIVGVASFVYYASDRTGIRWDRISRRVS